MKRLAQILSFLALGSTLASAWLFFTDELSLPQAQLAMLLAAVLWFVTAPFWMEHKAR